MTAREFRYEFDLLYNNIMSDMAPGLDDYEVSLFLTEAQEKVVTQLYSGVNFTGGFESAEKVRRYLANLIRRVNVNADSNPALPSPSQYHDNDYLEYDIDVNDNLMVFISERVVLKDSECCDRDKSVNVTPIKYDELNKVMENPFRRPNNRQALRVDDGTHAVRILSKTDIVEYSYDYLKRPDPIIVSDLPEGFSINGVTTMQTSELDESLHRTILDYAVQLAAASWANNNKS